MFFCSLQGVPIRIEVGPRDMKQNQYVAVRRDTGAKETKPKDSLETDIPSLLDNIHDSMFAK